MDDRKWLCDRENCKLYDGRYCSNCVLPQFCHGSEADKKNIFTSDKCLNNNYSGFKIKG